MAFYRIPNKTVIGHDWLGRPVHKQTVPDNTGLAAKEDRRFAETRNRHIRDALQAAKSKGGDFDAYSANQYRDGIGKQMLSEQKYREGRFDEARKIATSPAGRGLTVRQSIELGMAVDKYAPPADRISPNYLDRLRFEHEMQSVPQDPAFRRGMGQVVVDAASGKLSQREMDVLGVDPKTHRKMSPKGLARIAQEKGYV